MKVYISEKKTEDKSYNHIPNIMMLDNTVLDNEATEIIVDEYISQFSVAELSTVFSKILSKLRINGSITVIDKDLDIVCMRYSRGELSIEEFNKLVFGDNSKKCMLNLESVVEPLSNGFNIEKSSIDSKNGSFIVTARRSVSDSI